MKKKVFILGFVLALCSSIIAQQNGANISFEATVHDFGTINEEDGPVTNEFKFTNTGSIPLIVQNVKPSCGCTSPSWTKEPVAPGGSGVIKATFNPKGRPGKFSKTIAVHSNSNKAVTVLTIKGVVIPKEKTPEDIYKQTMTEGLRLKAKVVSFPKLFVDQKDTKTLEIMNFGDAPISLTFAKVPGHLTVKAEPETLQAKQKGEIIVSYEASKKEDWGYVRDYFFVDINGNHDNNNRLTVTANIQEDFSSWTPEQMSNAPKVEFETTNFNFGDITSGEKVDLVYKFKNTGKSPLIIRKVKAACGCTAIQPGENIIQPGKSSEIKASFNSRGRTGSQRKTITVITNDPKQQTVILRLTGNVN